MQAESGLAPAAQRGTGNPFDLDDEDAYVRWRDAKLARYPQRLADLVVEVRDPRRLTSAERGALLRRLREANMAIYASALIEGKEIPREIGLQFGLQRLDANFLADEDGISSIAVAPGEGRGEFIPYTTRPINWHTDGYYNPVERRVRSMILHCVRNAAQGGENRLLDHELAYLRLRDQDPEHVRALMAPQAMTIPPRRDADGEARPAQSGPVFSVLPDGELHMRYTARRVSIEWKDDARTRAAVAALEHLLADDGQVLRGRLQPGMGLICNNVLHDRSGFVDDPAEPRLLYRARYYERIAGTGWRESPIP